MSNQDRDYHNFELPYQNSGFEAEINARTKRPNCCFCACFLGCFGFLLAIVLAVFAVWYCIFSGGAELVVSPETTIITEPLKPDGTVDFHEAIQEMLRPDAQPDANGFRDVLLGYGPEVFAGDRRSALLHTIMCTELGIDPDIPPAHRLVPFEPDNVQAWLGIVGDGLDAAGVAAAKPHYFVPLVRESDREFVILSQPFAVYVFHERLSDALRARAGERFASQDVDAAWKDVLASIRLFRRATVNQARLKASADDIDESLLTPVNWVADTLPDWTTEQLTQGIKDLESLPSWQDRQTTLTILQFKLLDILSSMHDLTDFFNRFDVRQEMPVEPDHPAHIPDEMLEALSQIAFDWNAVAKALNREIKTYEDLMEQAAGKSLDEQFELLNLYQDDVPLHVALSSDEGRQNFLLRYFKETAENPLGVFAASGRSRLIGFMAGRIITWEAGEMYRLQIIEDSRCEALRLALALELFRRNEGHYPDTLAELGLQPDVHFEYEKRGTGYRIQNKVLHLLRE